MGKYVDMMYFIRCLGSFIVRFLGSSLMCLIFLFLGFDIFNIFFGMINYFFSSNDFYIDDFMVKGSFGYVFVFCFCKWK